QLGAQSWLTAKLRATRSIAPWVPFIVAFGLIGIVMAVLIVANVVSGAEIGRASCRGRGEGLGGGGRCEEKATDSGVRRQMSVGGEGALCVGIFFFSSRRRHTRLVSDWSSDVCSSDLSLARSRG